MKSKKKTVLEAIAFLNSLKGAIWIKSLGNPVLEYNLVIWGYYFSSAKERF